MSTCIDTISRHVSIRRFKPDPVPENDLRTILEAARRAPTSWNLQPVTIIAVTDQGLKQQLADAVGGQEHVAEAPVFLVFAADYHKLLEASRSAGVEAAEPGLGHLVTAAIDVGISSGWAALAAETLGYGIVFIALYSNPCRVAEILSLPKHVIPLVGLALGKPAESPQPRPRQPPEVFASINKYPSPPDLAEKVRSAYRSGGAKLFRYVLAPGAYYDQVTNALLECMKKQGYRAP
ncbi:oxygen-insensitive NADPH nitroreductase [Pyrofollis japonicus]|uniref:nitroreductase family protein n=1 Tax=Pyrofollis japonicus TaxID=3060460 RepID=UPI00295AAAE9|nr:nitroreductase family protein [Pyrofollis japonicus]BEP18403.1 oxygen-insensitive NADPH nitroreductase [Pyrofollis japonicus]